MCTAYVGRSDPDLVFDEPSPWRTAFRTRSVLEDAMKTALAGNGAYPSAEAETMLASLGWRDGLQGLLRARPSSIKLTLSYDACALTPELVPVQGPEGSAAWLDTLAPMYRSLDHVEQRQVQRLGPLSLAIVFQEEEIFYRLAEALQRDLDGQAGLIVDSFRGGDLLADPRLVVDVLHAHRAVLFLGHLHRGDDNEGGGWQLTEDAFLPMAELKSLLGGSATGRRPIPEVVFANCCSSAWRERGTADVPGIWYPKLFLDAGVRFFIGTWMDVVLSASHLERDQETLRTLGREFFRRWAESPDRAVDHLFAAKRECGFPLLTALYQIYTAGSEPAAASARTAAEPLGALVSGVRPGDRLGEYRLGEEMWADPFSRTFWAETTAGSRHLVEVLVDEWQDSPGLVASLDAAIARLAAAALGPEHLVPSRHRVVMLSHQGKDRQALHVLVYDLADTETRESWSTLAALTFDRAALEHFMATLKLGSEISLRLSELHERGLRHGNLHPGSVLLLRRPHEPEQILLKDTWVAHTRPGRYVQALYAAPEEAAQERGVDELKYDCWSLGIVLLEIVAGQVFGQPGSASFQPAILDEALGARPRMPEALARVIRECLVPSAKLRPAASLIARRLLLALHAGGDYVGELEEQLRLYLQAGQRLFFVTTDDLDEVESVLAALASRVYPAAGEVRYQLYVAAEGRGLIEQRSRRTVEPWMEEPALRQLLARLSGGAPAGRLSPPEVAALNAGFLLDRAVQLRATPGELPIVLVRGNGWWDTGPPAWRLLRLCQAEPATRPAFVIADRVVSLQGDLARQFVPAFLPPPSPAAMFEQILAFRRDLPDAADGIGETSAEEAIDLAVELFPCSMRELEEVLRLCWLRHGTIDRRVVALRDEERQRLLAPGGVATFIPSSRLAGEDDLGLATAIDEQVASWALRMSAPPRQFGPSGPPRRVLVSGPGGCGKTALAHALAARTGRPLVRIDAGLCLHGQLGESETALRVALASATAIHACLVLLDDVDRFFGDLARTAALTATATRMSGVVIDWLDSLTPGLVAVVTATRPELLPTQWRRRLEVHFALAAPASAEERQEVFASAFRRRRLLELAADRDLMGRLARKTAEGVFTPEARRAAGALAGRTTRLSTGAEIEQWVHDTILLHARQDARPDARPESDRFWLDALAAPPAQGRKKEGTWKG